MTRAKKLLHIHYNNYSPLQNLPAVKIVQNNIEYQPVNRISIFLTLRDVNLSHFKDKHKQKEIDSLSGNENLPINISIFSAKFKERISELKNKGYGIKEMKVNFVVYWKGEDMSEEIKIILPKVVFERISNPAN
jgi:ATP-dependent DNA helicase RecQ